MRKHQVGTNGPWLSVLGFGAMAMTGTYESTDEQQAVRALQRAVELGINWIDTADFYGKGRRTPGGGQGYNEILVGGAIKGFRDEIILETKGGLDWKADGVQGPNGDPTYIRQACEASLKRLQVDYVDVYLLHRVDPEVPVEETVGAMSRLVEEGKTRFIGLCEASARDIRRAHSVHPITVIQSEYSLFNRGAEKYVFPVLEELGIGFQSFGTLARGLLTGGIKSRDDLAPDDGRLASPWLQPENFEKNVTLILELEKIAKELNITTAQLALAWAANKTEHHTSLFGAWQVIDVEQNARAGEIELSQETRTRVEAIFAPGAVAGPSFPPSYARMNRTLAED